MRDFSCLTVAQIVADNIRSADVFKKHGIDFCCGGKVLLTEVCAKKQLDFDVIIAELNHLSDEAYGAQDFQSWDLDFLADYIVKVYHKYTREALELLEQYADKVAKVHGGEYPETLDINVIVQAVSGELNSHMDKEENVLFPYIKGLADAHRHGETVLRPPFGTVKNPIFMMEQEHTETGDALKSLEKLTKGFLIPEGACNTFKALYTKLKEFQDKTFEHIHLENNILFPKAIALEAGAQTL